MRGAMLLLLSLGIGNVPVAAQTSVRGPLPSLLWSRAEWGPLHAANTLVPSDSVPRTIQPTHWKEGALVGGTIGALGGAVLFAAFCRSSEQADRNCTGSALVGGLVGALVLGLPGALIGGQFPKGGNADSVTE